MRCFYADNLCLVTQGSDFNKIKRNLTEALTDLSQYHVVNDTISNPGKTQVFALYLTKEQA